LIVEAIYYAHQIPALKALCCRIQHAKLNWTGIHFKFSVCKSVFKSVYICTPDHSNCCIMRRTSCILRVELPKCKLKSLKLNPTGCPKNLVVNQKIVGQAWGERTEGY